MSLITIHSPEEAEQCKQLDRFTERIRERAHSLFEGRSGAEGHALDDWLQAEQELLFTPAMSREDRDDELVLQADMAQFRPKEIHIDITAEAIIVTAEHALKANGKEVVKQCVARFDLGNSIQPHDVQAKLRAGVLSIHVGKPKGVHR